ncbi:hypothetical protein NARC_150010 [Candidatus Nitrosocosmicus arcticus]|uniref:Uncharacterized protein n=1 Tax=Candidatus Nitrosocosmicus arcticus TaxID=2035267 RepID=A0A557SS31_9ARCH|nr:hypothetical protein NARC_150010 [Candidatus Nitrosocosmicus arcticus]
MVGNGCYYHEIHIQKINEPLFILNNLWKIGLLTILVIHRIINTIKLIWDGAILS